MGPILVQDDLNWLTSAKTPCPHKVTFTGMGGLGLQNIFWGTQFNPQEVAFTQLTIVFMSVTTNT